MNKQSIDRLDIERRGPVRKIEHRKTDQGVYISGYAAVFYDIANPDATQFRLWTDTYERIMPGAFNNALARPDDVRCLFNHDDSFIVGRNAAGTMTLTVDKVGLRFETLLPQTEDGKDLAIAIERGDVTGCSFGFRADNVAWRSIGDQEFREIVDVTLYDVGPCTYPAYAGTSVEAAKRSLLSHREDLKREADKRIESKQRQLRLSRLADK